MHFFSYLGVYLRFSSCSDSGAGAARARDARAIARSVEAFILALVVDGKNAVIM